MPKPRTDGKPWDYTEYIGFRQIYLDYDRKTYDLSEGKVPKPYFSKTERSDHPGALTYKQWSSIAETYLTILIEDLRTGILVRLPEGMGDFFFQRFVPKKDIIDFPRTKAAGKVVKRRFRFIETMGWWWCPRWYHVRGGVALKKWWRLRLSPKSHKATCVYYREDANRILQLPI